jgi:hypothetical protein
MRIDTLRIGQKVKHPQYGIGVVTALREHTAEVRLEDNTIRTVSPEGSGLEPAEAWMEAGGLQLPLATFVKDVVSATVTRLGLEAPTTTVDGLSGRWHKGRLVLHPADPALATKQIEIEVFFHKIVMIRNNLRVLEQKINAHEKLSEAEKIEWQQYVTRCYGSMTSFNVLFKDKEDQF